MQIYKYTKIEKFNFRKINLRKIDYLKVMIMKFTLIIHVASVLGNMTLKNCQLCLFLFFNISVNGKIKESNSIQEYFLETMIVQAGFLWDRGFCYKNW